MSLDEQEPANPVSSSQRVAFVGSHGRKLAGILDMPPDQTRGFVVLAHCFTCSKDLKANFRIGRQLANRGWGVLRFDFAGIGLSEGNFPDTNFETNRVDLIAATQYLTQSWQPPLLLLGHSFGGAAAMSVANEIDSVRGIVTIAAPSDTVHLANLLAGMNPSIEQDGEGEVTIGGRKFMISKQMLEDFTTQDLPRYVSNLAKPLLILHSPKDTTVGYYHALRLFSLASQPSPNSSNEDRAGVSLMTLPGSDHLLTKNLSDIDLIVAWIDAWLTSLISKA